MSKHIHLGSFFIAVGLLFTLLSMVPRSEVAEFQRKKLQFDDSYELTAALRNLPHIFDPNLVQSATERDFLRLMFDDLFVLRGSANVLSSHLVKEWHYDPIKFVYTLRIQPDIRFWNGVELTSTILNQNFERWLQPRAFGSSQLFGIEGAFSFRNGGHKTISGIHELSRYELQIRLTQHDGLFLRTLANGIFKISTQDDDGKVVGTGPFQVESVQPEELVLERNEDYFRGRPNFAKLRFKKMAHEQLVAALNAGEIDLTWNDITITFDEIPDGYDKHTSYGDRTIMLYMNTKVAHFSTKERRLAIINAIDSNRIVKECSVGSLATAIIPPRHLGHNPSNVISTKGRNTKLVTWPSRKATIFIENLVPDVHCFAEILNENFKAHAVPLKVKVVPFRTIQEAWLSNRLAAAIEPFTFPPENEIRAFLYFSSVSSEFLIGRTEADYQKLIDLTKKVTSLEARGALLQELDLLTRSYGYAFPISHVRENFLVRKQIYLGQSMLFRRSANWTNIGKVKL